MDFLFLDDLIAVAPESLLEVAPTVCCGIFMWTFQMKSVNDDEVYDGEGEGDEEVEEEDDGGERADESAGEEGDEPPRERTGEPGRDRDASKKRVCC